MPFWNMGARRALKKMGARRALKKMGARRAPKNNGCAPSFFQESIFMNSFLSCPFCICSIVLCLAILQTMSACAPLNGGCSTSTPKIMGARRALLK